MGAIGFLILHYKTYDETLNCIKSIEKLEDFGLEKKIIVIDNNSNDGSFEKITSKYTGEDYQFFSLSQNVGFSKANNLGYSIVKKNKNIKYLIVCNSDIVFFQSNIIELIEQAYDELKFYILGPDVFCPGDNKNIYKGHQSPAYPWESTRYYTKMKILYNNIYMKKLTVDKSTVNFIDTFIYVWAKVNQIFEKMITKLLFYNWRNKPHENVAIHGSCIILSELFLERFDVLFEPETFFYYEELLLYLRMKKERLIVFYNNELKVHHMQGRATTNAESDKKQRKLFVSKNLNASAEIYLKALKEQ